MRTWPQEFIDVKHILTQDERNQMSFSLAEKQIEISGLEDEKKSVTSTYKAKIDAKTAEVKLLSHQIKDGYITLTVHAEKRRNYMEKRWEWWDTASGEMVKTEPFAGTDFQMTTDDVDDQGEPIQDVEHQEVRMLSDGSEGDGTPFVDVPNDDPDGGDPSNEKPVTKGPKKNR